MNEGFPEYRNGDRFPSSQPEGICRGCRCPIDPKLEPRAQTWHKACQGKFHPFYVKLAIKKRAGEKCEQCGKDCSRVARIAYNATKPKAPHYYYECGLEYPYNSKAYYSHPLYKAYEESRREWQRRRPSPEFDHIIPHCEGGLFTVENIRLWCRPCHLKRTAEWHKARATNKL